MLLFYILPVLWLFLLIKYGEKTLYYIPVMFLLWDLSDVFVPDGVVFIYIKLGLVLLSSLYLFSLKNFYFGSGFGVYLYLFYVFFSLSVTSGSFNLGIRYFISDYSSLILLPLAFYSSLFKNKKHLNNSVFLFISIWAIFVLYFTIYKIGIEDARKFGDIIYFGTMASKGGITYIAFAILLIPLVFPNLSKTQKIIVIASVLLILFSFLTSLKRATFVIVGAGTLYYMYRMKSKYIKQIFIFAIAGFFVFLIYDDDISSIVYSRYTTRGEEKFTSESVENDSRLFEILAVFESNNASSLIEKIFGGGINNVLIDVGNESDRKVHNTYASVILTKGILGLILYLNIFIQIFIKYRKITKYRKIISPEFTLYSMVFLALFWIFIGQGMIGGATGVTLRGLVFFALALMLNYLNEMKNEELYGKS
jgi:hypothetical protein